MPRARRGRAERARPGSSAAGDLDQGGSMSAVAAGGEACRTMADGSDRRERLVAADRGAPSTVRYRDLCSQPHAVEVCCSSGARDRARTTARAFGNHYTAACRHDCANRRERGLYRWRSSHIGQPGPGSGMQEFVGARMLTAREPPTVSGGVQRLSVSLVGRLAVRFNGRLVEFRTQKGNAVLSYLALTETKHESRERLVGLLWSRSDEEKARASLRQVVRELRSAFEDAGYSGFVAGRLAVHLDTEKVELDVDVESVVRLAENGSVHPLLLNTPRLGERILEGMDDLDPSLRIWVLAERQTIHDRLMRSLGAGLITRRADGGAKDEIAAAIVNLDPTHEEACCHLMRSHAEQGDIAGALRIYKALWNLLDRDYGMEPAPATEALVAEIKLGAFERPAGQGDAAPRSPRAVLAEGDRADRPGPSDIRHAPASTNIGLELR